MAIPILSGSSRVWHFFRAGGFDQVRLTSGADLAALDQLDQKLWVALACPTRGLEFDNRTLDLIDTDQDGRIRAPEILAAVKWTTGLLKNPDDLLKGAASLPLAAINEATPEGQRILKSARQILSNLGKADAREVSLDDTTDTVRIFARTKFNGDGIVPADAADSPEIASVIADALACVGGENDRSGKPGITQAKLDQFFGELAAYAGWCDRAEKEEAALLPLGAATEPAAAALRLVRAKVDDYFARCRLVAFDTRALAALNRQESEYLAIAAKDMAISVAEIAAFPLARIEAGRPLPLKEGVNPAWAAAVAALAERAVKPLLGERVSLSEADWAALTAKLAAYEAWLNAKAGAVVEKLGLPRVREILAGPAQAAIAELIVRDKALEPEANSIAAVDKLVRLHRDLYKLLNNYVNFSEFYGRRDKAVFQAGTLYLDQRSCDLVVRVDDAGKHAALAGLSKACLAYCDCTRPATGQKMTIAAAFTNGDSDHLMVGRNGVFYDRQGRDWDATITKLIDNPISIRQAFWSPYKKFVRMIEEQVAKRAAASEAKSTASLESAATTVTTADQARPGAPGAPPPKKMDVGTVAALGVGVGAIATVIGGFIAGFLGLKLWQMLLAVAGLMLLISLPSVVIAWLKLRQRNLGPILDANGWAVNTRARINIPFGRSLTGVARLPRGSRRDLADPYADKKSGRYWVIAILVLLAAVWALWNWGLVERVAPDVFPKSGWVQNRMDQGRW